MLTSSHLAILCIAGARSWRSFSTQPPHNLFYIFKCLKTLLKYPGIWYKQYTAPACSHAMESWHLVQLWNFTNELKVSTVSWITHTHSPVPETLCASGALHTESQKKVKGRYRGLPDLCSCILFLKSCPYLTAFVLSRR
jgi:hypothetical protein